MQGEWVRIGSVQVVNGSPIVHGNATAWRYAGVIVGDFFVGPDEKFYEITAVYEVGAGVGDTAYERIVIRSITGVDEYAGTTDAAGVYAIVRNWSNTTNSILAAKIADLLQTGLLLPGGGLITYGTGDPPIGDYDDGVLYVKY